MVNAEYAVLITDEWQKRDLGQILTKYCTEIAKEAGVSKITAETTKDNKPMVAVFRKLGFEIIYNEDTTVTCLLNLK